ncbi:YlbF family regulator [Enterococcus sp. DIV1298c]|uniref:YlbF family regulator n=1 Tax=Enterococcus sp. DIV1298c TaxID=2815328 RepID=UPI001A9355A0|nr:YlbF family regulator [Enterococcus sp. DIV1298c]
MIINDELFQLEDQCNQLVQTILTSHLMEQYLKNKKEMDRSIKVAQLKNEFISSRQAFEKIEPYGKYVPEFREKQRAVRQAKRQLDLNEEVAAFRISENELQKILDSIGKQLAHTISTEIKISAGSPFFEKSEGCGGNCHGHRK